jgi:hypothetical protein
MIGEKQIQGEKALALAKLQLLKIGKLDLQYDRSRQFDLIVYDTKNPEKFLAIEIKATKQPKSKVVEQAKAFRLKTSKVKFPIIKMFINYDETEKGWYTLNWDSLLVHSLETSNLANSIQNAFDAEVITPAKTQARKFVMFIGSRNSRKESIRIKKKSVNKITMKQAQKLMDKKVFKRQKLKLASSKTAKVRNPRFEKV